MNRYFVEHRFNRTSLLIASLFGILAGLVWAYFGATTSSSILLACFLSVPFSRYRYWPSLIITLVIGLNIGLWRGSSIVQELNRYEALISEQVVIRGTVADDAAYSDRGQTEFHVQNIVLEEDEETPLIGRVRVRGFNAVGVRRGDSVRVSGKMYKGYGNRQGSLSFAVVEVITRSPSAVEDIRSKFFAGVYTALPEPNASLGLGFLVGLRTLLPESLLDQLSATGLTHIVAVSGYNLTILIRLTRRLFSKRSKFISLATSISLMTGFLLVTGLSPSIFRASVVSGFALLAWYFGRKINPILLLLLGAAITAFISPLYIWLDLGWHLSFAAFAGVLILAPLIQQRLFKERPKLLPQIIIETTSAQIAALPIIVVVFGELSLISLLANVIILPLIPLAMLLTFIAGLGGMLGPFMAGWVSWPANIILTFMTDSISIMSSAPWALKEIEASWTQMAVFYSFVIYIAIILFSRKRASLSGTEVIE